MCTSAAPTPTNIVHWANLFDVNACPKHHTFTFLVIGLCLNLIEQAGLSPAQVVQVLKCIRPLVDGLYRIPCRRSIADWHSKWAVYQLTNNKPAITQEQEMRHWAVLCDISIVLGGKRILLVLGVDLSHYNFGTALRLQDVNVLAVGVQDQRSWTAKRIVTFFRKRVLNFCKVDYAVTDGGPSLVKAMKVLRLERVDDISHAVARHLKARHVKREDYQALIKGSTHFRRYNTLTKSCRLRPPQLRGTARFMNITPLARWACEVLDWMAATPGTLYRNLVCDAQIRQKFEWLLPLQDYVRHLDAQCQGLRLVEKVLKQYGVGRHTLIWWRRQNQRRIELRKLDQSSRLMVQEYLDHQVDIARRVGRYQVLCSTDLVESSFGRFKHRSTKHPKMSKSCLRIATYGQPILEGRAIAEIMESHTMEKVTKYIQEELFFQQKVPL